MKQELTLVGLISGARSHLAAAGVIDTALDSRLLMQHALQISHAEILAEPRKLVSVEEAARFGKLVARRAQRVPLAYLTGEKEFYGRAFHVNESVLIPRPETEHLLEAALALVPPSANGCVIELGVGSGALLVSLLAERPNLLGIGVDLSLAAIEVSRINATSHGVHSRAAFLCGDWGQSLAGSFDLALSNPPYLSADEMKNCQAELEFEPRLALAGGVDGLVAFQQIAVQLPRLMRPGAQVLLEIGASQGAAVRAALESAGLRELRINRDLAGHERVIAAKIPQQGVSLTGEKKGLERAPLGANLPRQS